MEIKEFDYELPKELIAQYPTKRRGESRLLVIHRREGKIEHKRFHNIVEYLREGDVLVLNETKVIPARLIGRRIDTHGKVEILLLKPYQNAGANFSCNTYEWEVLISPVRAKKPGVRIEFGPELTGEVKTVTPKTIFKFNVNHNQITHGRETTFHSARSEEAHFYFLLEKYGRVPLPPYIKREPQELDKKRYQTVYATIPGACAAPTAGLHFTHKILNEIKNKGVEIAKIILHTSLGTFKPIKCDKVEDHKMDEEYYEIHKATASKINLAERVVAVGTSTVRALETAAIGGRSRFYLRPHTIERRKCFRIQTEKGWTNKFIYPPYEFKVVDALVTNFHLPRSTLLLLVSAFAGHSNILKAYQEAIKEGYRFYSYGDAMLII